MGKVIDITDKLSFSENPVLQIKEEKIEVQADAETMLKIIGLFDGEKNEIAATKEAAELLFSKDDKKKIADLRLSMKDYMNLIELAMDTAMGEIEGEQ